MIVRICTTSILLLFACALAVGLAAATVASARPSQTARVGVVLDVAGMSNPIERAMVDGVRRAVDRFGVRAEVVIPTPREGARAALSRFARQGYDLVLLFDYGNTVAALDVARRYPQTTFAAMDFSRANFERPPPNLVGIPFREQEIGYVVGYLAGTMERTRSGRDVLGAVGGFAVPAVERFIAGFAAGARTASPRTTVLTAYSGSFTAPAKCRRVAQLQLARGAGTVFDVAGYCGTGTLAAAKAARRWAIGVDFDRSGLGPFVLTSAVKRFDVAALRVIGLVAEGRLRAGRDYPQTLRTGGLGLGRFSPLVPPGVRAKVRAVARDVAAGRVPPIRVDYRQAPPGGVLLPG